MYTLKLTYEEIAALQFAIWTAQQRYKAHPEIFQSDLANMQSLIQKSFSAEYTPEGEEET